MAYFYSLPVETHQLSQLQETQPFTWWQGLEDAQHGLIFLHGYGDRKLGEHKGIVALSAQEQKILWENKELTFYGITEDGILVYPASDPENKFALLQFETGAVLSEKFSQHQAMEKVDFYTVARNINCLFPLHYKEGEAYFEQVRNFLSVQLPCKPVKAIDYAETENFIICSFYETDAFGELNNQLVVFDLEGNLYLHETLGTRLKGIGTDTFFIFKEILYFIQNRSFLTAYKLHH